ncbi:hypothetical protein NDU88_005573 [Pleurodeles waltl]|uniref:Uncharacterized protein n=1 Tax=Pleurodeles waltl TaxID=8319 RepID=A0AAV7RLF8_PLEWA|nr:hypothetical protein NDU88_005573 [Pleurodeles waltl]
MGLPGRPAAQKALQGPKNRPQRYWRPETQVASLTATRKRDTAVLPRCHITNSSTGPAEPYPGGTRCSHADPEMISDVDIRVRTPSIEEDGSPEEKRAAGGIEGDANEEKTEQGPEGETRSGKEKDSREDEEA